MSNGLARFSNFKTKLRMQRLVHLILFSITLLMPDPRPPPRPSVAQSVPFQTPVPRSVPGYHERVRQPTDLATIGEQVCMD